MTVYLYSPNQNACAADQWDYAMLRDILIGRTWNIAEKTTETILYNHLPKTERAVVVIPARHNAQYIDEINRNLQNIDRVVLFLLGDEEAVFEVERIAHDNISIWVQNPHPVRHDKYYKLGTGYPPQLHEHVKQADKTTDIFFAGQITHNRRTDMKRALINSRYEVEGFYSSGFTQGLEPSKYYQGMCAAKYAPCPSGAVIPDSFRVFEALECMAVPIADEVNPDKTINGYWDWLFGEPVPFMTIRDWSNLDNYISEVENLAALRHKITAWYLHKKRELCYEIYRQYYA